MIKLLLILLLLSSNSYASPIVLYGSDNQEKGTASNPIKVSVIGGGVGGGSGNVGVGTTNYLPVYVGVGTLSSSNVVNVSGNVGIASTTPGARLDVVGIVRATSFQGVSSGDSYTNGNLGVGNAAPATALDVTGTGTFSVAVSTPRLSNLSTDGFVKTTGTNGTLSVDATSYISGTGTQYKVPLFDGAGAVTDSVITDTGNVGINTASPKNQLDVFGTAEMTGFKLTTGASASYILQANSVGVGTWVDPSTVVAGGGGSGTITSSTINQVPRFSATGTTIVGATNLWSDNTNVGIGTSAPTALLGIGTGNLFKVTSAGAVTAVGITNSAGYTQSGTTANTFTGTPTFSNATYSALFTGGNVGIGSVAPEYGLVINTGGLKVGSVNNFALTGGGNIGVGTAIPAAAVDIAGTGSKLRMQSPDGTFWNCQPANTTGTFTCT